MGSLEIQPVGELQRVKLAVELESKGSERKCQEEDRQPPKIAVKEPMPSAELPKDVPEMKDEKEIASPN
ncbi:hypothetical protein [Brevibacillus massiliensis]|uniref:hypothetical protein n=1 Tax=Brevibacillus massiliensis TaxID=1118054 RepID=UPI0002E05096|nr:hypothetical protein [Brevibacillus massiliensis]